MTLLKINRLLSTYISIVLLKFEVDIHSQSKVRVRKSKNPIWPPGGHFESDVAEKLDLCSGNHVVYRQTDGRTRWIQYTPPPPPPQLPTSLGGGINIQVLELMQMHPKERLRRVILTASWFIAIDVGQFSPENSLRFPWHILIFSWRDLVDL